MSLQPESIKRLMSSTFVSTETDFASFYDRRMSFPLPCTQAYWLHLQAISRRSFEDTNTSWSTTLQIRENAHLLVLSSYTRLLAIACSNQSGLRQPKFFGYTAFYAFLRRVAALSIPAPNGCIGRHELVESCASSDTQIDCAHVFGRFVWSTPEGEPAGPLEACRRVLLLQKMLFYWTLLARGRPSRSTTQGWEMRSMWICSTR